ncbi:hypothetical protein [Streptomyces chartreusis]|uniref:hypothetical protein n=1 Tax=Streptomyces chartreusis TaxID=1969 RepID=UPI003808F0F4
MSLFIAGLLLGGISGGGTYGFTFDTPVAVLVGGVVAVLTWRGVFTRLTFDR